MPEHDAESKVAIEGNGDPRELEMEGDGAEAPVLAPAVSAAPAAPVAAPAVPVSGLYVRDPQPANVLEELRIDVDGRYPQMVASGTVYRPLQARMHWAAELEQIGPNRWRGPIFFEHPRGARSGGGGGGPPPPGGPPGHQKRENPPAPPRGGDPRAGIF